jgi:hypothetical protein
MKTLYRILTIPHKFGGMFAIEASGFRLGEIKRGRVCVEIDVDTFTDVTFLVVSKWMKV